MKERIQKFIAATGYLSRRNAEEAILAGRVKVNGQKVIELGTKIDPNQDEIEVDGQRLYRPSEYQTVLLHKPRRVMTTKFDPEGRKTVMDFLPKDLQTLKPVGRLDYDSEGLILLTNDGELANQIAHPSFGIRKIYRVWVVGKPSYLTLQKLTQKVELADGPGHFETVEQKNVRKVSHSHEIETELEIEVSEGRNRFIRRMMEEVDHRVVRLIRIQVGGLKLGNLRPGAFRELRQQDIEQISPCLKSKSPLLKQGSPMLKKVPVPSE